jgi:hypothetical protein
MKSSRTIKGFDKEQGFDVEAYRNRLRIMREVISGETATEFAKRLEVDFKRWHNYERGYPIPREIAFLIHQKFKGMSIEWLYFGTTQSLSKEYRVKIEKAYKLDSERQQLVAEHEKIKTLLDRSDEKRRRQLRGEKPPAKRARRPEGAPSGR